MSDELIEAMARLIDPRAWAEYVRLIGRADDWALRGKPGGVDFEKMYRSQAVEAVSDSLSRARALIPIIRAHLEPTSEMVEAVMDYGPQTHDSTTDKVKVYFLPWRSWRHVRRSLYDLGGQHFADLPHQRGMAKLGTNAWHNSWTVQNAIEEACPTASFEFDDYDGERITAKTRIEEREWLLGEGKFKWLSWFRRPNIRRSLDISFSKETGSRKGSWKGGTIGHSIDMLPGELHEAAFRRYCAEHQMTFVGAQVEQSA